MQKKKSRIFPAVITALFVLSVSYFALLSPTTAWYYQDFTKTATFSFNDYTETYSQVTQINDLEVPLRDATRFADAGELLFDEVAHVITVPTRNASGTGGLDGLVKVKVSKLDGSDIDTGLHWFAFAPATAVASPSNGAYKAAIENMLTDFGITPQTYSGETAGSTTGGYNGDYNDKALTALDAYNERGFLLAPSATEQNIYIVFWAEYGELMSDIRSSTVWKDSGSDTHTFNDILVTVEARPYMAEYAEAYYTLTLDNYVSGSVSIYADGMTLTPAATVQVPAHTQLRVVANEVSNTQYTFAGSSMSGNTGAVLTGDNDTVCAIADMQDNVTLTVGTVSGS